MDPELIKKILEVIASQDQAAALALLPELVAAEAGDSVTPPDPNASPLAAAADPKPKDPNAPGAEPMAASALSKALGHATDAEAAEEIKRLRKQVAEQTATSAAVELDARRDLITELVKLRVEFPATAWALKDADGKALKPEDRVPCIRLMAEPIADLRARVAVHKANAPKQPAVREHEPPTAGDKAEAVAKLSKVELDACKKKGITPEDYIERKANAARRSA